MLLPLKGVRVLEFAAIGPVPWCAMLLADLGADVVRVDRPNSPDPAQDLNYVAHGRRTLELNLKEEGGRQAALSLMRSADLILEGFRPGTMERLGIGPDEAHAVNPALVYGRMTGWGQNGPMSAQAGHDINYIALSGVLHAIGTSERPVLPLNLVGDFGGGSTFLAIGVLSGLLQARINGRGTVVDSAMVDGSALLLSAVYSRHANAQWEDKRAVNTLDGGAPWYDVYRTSDGKFIAVGAIEEQFYSLLLSGLGLAKETMPPRHDRSQWEDIRNILRTKFLERTRDEWASVFEGTDACVTPVLSLTEAPLHPHNQSRFSFLPWNGGHVPTGSPRFDSELAGSRPASERCTLASVFETWPARARVQ